MWEFLSEHIPDLLLAVEILLFAFYQKKPKFLNSKQAKEIAKQEKKVAKDYQKLKVDESLLEELKKGGDE